MKLPVSWATELCLPVQVTSALPVVDNKGTRTPAHIQLKNCRSAAVVSSSPVRQTAMKCKISVCVWFSCRTSSCQSLTETTVSWPPSWPTSSAPKAWWTIRTSTT